MEFATSATLPFAVDGGRLGGALGGGRTLLETDGRLLSLGFESPADSEDFLGSAGLDGWAELVFFCGLSITFLFKGSS